MAGDLIFGAVMDDAGTTKITAGTGFTQRFYAGSDMASQDEVQAGPGRPLPRRPSPPPSATWQMAAFKAATSATAPAVTATGTPASGTRPLAVSFTSTPSGGTSPYTYSWSFGDGSTAATTQNPSHTYTTAGSYTAKVTVTDKNGKTATASVAITATAAALPSVTASGSPTSGTAPLAVTFKATGTETGGTITGYSWVFGDSQGSTTQNPSHTYGQQAAIRPPSR